MPSQIEWKEKYQQAKEFMQTLTAKKLLIEIAGQHPLKDRLVPNEEFEARLLEGIRLYHLYQKDGYDVEIYVPGSRHKDNGVEDLVSLSQAGTDFLLKHNIPNNMLHGDDLNDKYKGEDGVYNSGDECFVAASYFIDQGFGKLLSVVAPNQVLRKELNYIWLGVLPLFYTAPVLDAYHSPVTEMFVNLPFTLNEDPTWQDPTGIAFILSRKDRKP